MENTTKQTHTTAKRIFSILLSFVMLLSITAGVDLSAYAATSGDYEYSVYNGKAEITGYTGSATDITIPSQLGGYTVTSIGDYAFWNCESLKSVTIPNSVASIGSNAFYYCKSLIRVTIPNGVTSIGYAAFEYCDSLTSISIPNSVTSIGERVFSYCTRLKSVTIGSGLASIGEYAFESCENLTNITVDSRNKYYSSQDGVLFNKDKTELVYYPTGNTRTSYTIPNSVKSVNNYAFWNCESLTNVAIPDSVTSIGDSAFSWCKGLTSVTIGNGVTSIGYGAFFSCISLANISIPDSVTTIDEGAFSWCESLTSIRIPESMASIGYGAFESCTSLKDVYYKGAKAQWNKIKIGDYNECLTNATKHYNSADGCTHSYQNVVTVKSTLSKNGSITPTCSICGATKDAQTIYYPKSISLSATSYTYDGNAKKPSVTVKDSNGNTISSSNYTVSVPTAKNPGKYTVKVTFKGNYEGTKNLTFTIKPRTTTIKLTSQVNGFKVNWSKRAETTGYQIQYATRSNFSNAATVYGGATNTLSKTITGRAGGAKYYVRVRTYKNIGNGNYVYGNWSSATAVTTGLAKANNKSTTGVSRGFKVTWAKISNVTGYQVQYSTRKDFKNAATVYGGNQNATAKTITGRARNTTYYVRVRAYKNNGGKYVYGAWSNARSVRTK